MPGVVSPLSGGFPHRGVVSPLSGGFPHKAHHSPCSRALRTCSSSAFGGPGGTHELCTWRVSTLFLCFSAALTQKNTFIGMLRHLMVVCDMRGSHGGGGDFPDTEESGYSSDGDNECLLLRLFVPSAFLSWRLEELSEAVKSVIGHLLTRSSR